jgi:hypothetical protein
MTDTNTNININTNTKKKMKVGLLNPISNEWFNLYSDILEISNNISDVDYIIYESNSDPVQIIEKVKSTFPKDKLVFILSGDTNNHIENECIWFTNAVKPSGLARKQTQIFVTNPAIFKFYDMFKNVDTKNNDISIRARNTDIYFKGTIWEGMRTNMYNAFANKPNCKIIKNDNYWNWRCGSIIKPTQTELENTANDSYYDLTTSKLCLCPKGNGNSSMRIIEALACGSIPILINDFSSPFDVSWREDAYGNEISLVFDTSKHSWDHMYEECTKLLNDKPRYEKMKNNGIKYFENVIYCDSKLNGFKMYNNIDTVAFGFSKLIIDKLYEIFNNKNN